MNKYLIEDPENKEFYIVLGNSKKEAFIKFITKILERGIMGIDDLIDGLGYKFHDFKDIPLYE